MEIIQMKVLGRRRCFNVVTGVVSDVTQRKVQRNRVIGASRLPITVKEFCVKDASTDQRQQAEAVPVDFKVRNGQNATLVFHRLGQRRQCLLAVRNNSTETCLVLPPHRPTQGAVLRWMAIGWLGFWVCELTVKYTHGPTADLCFIFIWLVAGIWAYFHARGVESRLAAAIEGGPSQLALMVDR
jgi:hypothetical protein